MLTEVSNVLYATVRKTNQRHIKIFVLYCVDLKIVVSFPINHDKFKQITNLEILLV